MRIKTGILASSALVASLAFSGCALVPSSGPGAGAIDSKAEARTEGYTVIEVTPAVITTMGGEQASHLASVFGDRRKASSSKIGIGDTVTISIWEAAEGGLFSSTTRTGVAEIPEQPVSEKGTISVPYVGAITVADRTPDQVKAMIEGALTGKAIEPQVLVHVVKNVSNTVTVTGEVAQSGRVALTARGERLLDAIALSGGPRIAAHLAAVQITRDNKTQSIPLELLISDPTENIYVQPGDIITLIRQPRSFSVFGATTTNAVVPFDESKLFLNQALAKVGGLNDERANAKGIFVYRSESADLVRRLLPGMPIKEDANGKTHVIYRIDLTDPNGFFLLKDFPVYDSDLIYIANSSLAEMRKFTALLGTVMGPVSQAASVNYTLSRQ